MKKLKENSNQNNKTHWSYISCLWLPCVYPSIRSCYVTLNTVAKDSVWPLENPTHSAIKVQASPTCRYVCRTHQ